MRNTAIVLCLVFLTTSCVYHNVDLDGLLCDEAGECLDDYKCNHEHNTCTKCTEVTQTIMCKDGGFSSCDEQGSWSDCIASDGGPPGGDSLAGDSFTPGDSLTGDNDVTGDSFDPGDSFVGDGNIPGDSFASDTYTGDNTLCTANICNGNGTCGAGNCTCDAGYDGNNCELCDVGFIGYPTCVDDPCDPDPCNGNGTCSTSDGSCTCTGDWVGDQCQLEVIVSSSGITPLADGVRTVYKFSMKSVENITIRGLYLTFDFRDQSGGATSITILSALLYEDLALLVDWTTPLPANTYFDLDISSLTTLVAGVAKDYSLVIEVSNFTVGDTLTTALALVTLQGGTEITVTGKEFTLP